MVQSRFVYFVYTTLALVFWEYFTLNRPTLSPSYYLNIWYQWCRWSFTKMGELLYWLSSFLDWFDFDDLLKAIDNLATPTIRTICSPWFVVVGYMNSLCNATHPLVVWCSTILIVGGVIYAYYKYRSKLVDQYRKLVD